MRSERVLLGPASLLGSDLRLSLGLHWVKVDLARMGFPLVSVGDPCVLPPFGVTSAIEIFLREAGCKI